jgi:hypothetical protein
LHVLRAVFFPQTGAPRSFRMCRTARRKAVTHSHLFWSLAAASRHPRWRNGMEVYPGTLVSRSRWKRPPGSFPVAEFHFHLRNKPRSLHHAAWQRAIYISLGSPLATPALHLPLSALRSGLTSTPYTNTTSTCQST